MNVIGTVIIVLFIIIVLNFVFKKYKFISKSSYERSRLSGRKKVNELKDGFLILLCILKMFIFRKWKKKLL